MQRAVWLVLVIACGDNNAVHSDAGGDDTPACDPAACPSDACHLATCVAGACALIDVGHCALPACANACATDADGDGLADAWETPDADGHRYVDLNCNGAYDGPDVDIDLAGADPARPDIFVRYDYMANADHSHQPPQAALDQVAQAFALHDIALHWIAPAAAIAETQVVSIDPDPIPACAGPEVVTMQQLRATAFAPILAQLGVGNGHPAYHYLVFGHNVTLPDTGSNLACRADHECLGLPDPLSVGAADIFGDDIVVAFGADVNQGFIVGIERFAGLTMHELGHNLGLEHGSLAAVSQEVCLTQKPNYVSVMDYLYEDGIQVAVAPGSTTPMPCTTDADCATGPCAVVGACHCTNDYGAFGNRCYRVDYSSSQLLTLFEAELDESAGVGGPSADQDLIPFLSNSNFYYGAAFGPIDWDHSGSIDATTVAIDLDDDTGTPNMLLHTTTDWDKLKLAFQCSPQFGAAVRYPP